MIIVDANVLVSLVNRRESAHQRCRAWFDSTGEQLIVSPLVVAEAAYLIDKYLGPIAEERFLDDVGIGFRRTYEVVNLEDGDLRRMAELVRTYGSLRLGSSDASVIAVAERLGVDRVATLDRRHFGAVRPRHVEAFTLLPG